MPIDFSGVNLEGIDAPEGNAGKQPEADLSGVDFTGVDLSGVDFSGIDLSGAAAPDAKPERKEIDYNDDDTAITRGFKAGIDQTQAIAGGAIGLLGDKLGLESVRDYGLEVYNRNMDEAGENAPETNFLDIDSVGSAANWAGYALGNAAPMLAASLLGGGIGGIAAKALTKKGIERFVKEQVENGVEREVAEATAKKMAQTAVGQGSAAGAVASSFGMSAGSIYGDTEDADVAVAHGIVAGALDAFPVIRALRKAGVGEQAVEEISESVVSEIAKQGIAEGGTEAVQTFIEQHASFWVQQNESLLANLDEVNVDEIIEAAAMGGLAGGVMGGGGAAYRKLNEKATAASDNEIGRSSSDIEDLLAGDAPDSGEIELAEDGAIKLLGNDDIIYADEPADAKQARAEREEANRRAFEGQFSPKEQPVLEGEILGPSAELDEAQQPGIKLLGNDGVIYAEEAPDIKAKRLEREQVSREAFEGQFPAPDYERMNANIEQREVAAQQRRDASLVRDLTADIPTPVLEQVRAQGADERLAAPLYRDMLPKLAGDLIENGGMGYITDEDGMIKGRAPSQNPDWFRNNGDIPSKGYVEKVVGKALNGDKLFSKEQRVLSAMLDAVDDERSRGNTADDLYEWESVMDLASLERAVDPSQPDVSLDTWAPDADDFFVELPDYDGGDLGQLATLWDQALVLGSTHDELKAIAESSANSEDMARGIYERIRQNIEATKADRGADRGSAEDNLAETSSDAPEIQGRADGEAGARSDAETYPQQDTPREQVESLDSQGLTTELQFPEAESNQEPVAPEGEAFGLTLYDEADLAERAEKESTADEAEAKAQIDRERELFSLDGGAESMAATAEKTQKPMAGDLFAGGSSSQPTQSKDSEPPATESASDAETQQQEANQSSIFDVSPNDNPDLVNKLRKAVDRANDLIVLAESKEPEVKVGGKATLLETLTSVRDGMLETLSTGRGLNNIPEGIDGFFDKQEEILSKRRTAEERKRFDSDLRKKVEAKLEADREQYKKTGSYANPIVDAEGVGQFFGGEAKDDFAAIQRYQPEIAKRLISKAEEVRRWYNDNGVYDSSRRHEILDKTPPLSPSELSVYIKRKAQLLSGKGRNWAENRNRYLPNVEKEILGFNDDPTPRLTQAIKEYAAGNKKVSWPTSEAANTEPQAQANDGDANARELAESANAFPAQAKVGEAYMRAQSRGPITAEQASTIRDFYAGDEGMEKLKSLADSTADMSPGDRMQAVIDLAIAPEKAKAAAIDEAAAEAALSPINDLPEPTEAQKEAGNYKKAKVRVLGREVTIENPKGSKRSGVDPDGNAWSVDMKTHYGYLNRTEGADGDHVDVFLGDNPDSEQVFVVDQVNADGSFDEHKVMVGFDSQEQAVEAYRGNYQDGWKVGPVTAMKADEFKAWLDTGDTTKPLSGEIKAGSESAPAPVLAKSGNPFKNKRAAKSAATKAGLPDAEVVPVEGGFGYLSESKPNQESKPSNNAASEPVSSAATVANQGSGALPDALRLSKKKYLEGLLKERGIKKSSPGYALQMEKAESRYELDVDAALAEIPFEQYRELNPELPEALARKSQNELRKWRGLPLNKPDSGAAIEAREDGASGAEQKGIDSDIEARADAVIDKVFGDNTQVEDESALYAANVTGSEAQLDAMSMGEPERKAFYDYLESRPDRDDILSRLDDLAGTPWAKQAVMGALSRQAMLSYISGKKPDFDSPLTKNKNSLSTNLELLGEEGLWEYLKGRNASKGRGRKVTLKKATRDGVIGHPEKPENAVNGSFIDCDPTRGCATFCYATKGHYNYASSINKSEAVTLAAELDPVRLGNMIADEYRQSPEFKLKKALRLFDKGDLSEAWVPVIAQANKRGIRTQIFSKRPEVLRKVDSMNLRMLSIDHTNIDKAEKYPDLNVAVVYDGSDFLTDWTLKNIDRVSVILPIKKGQRVLQADEIAKLGKSKDVKRKLCPIDSGRVSLGDYTCVDCDSGGGVGCFYGSVTDKVLKAATTGVKNDDEAASLLREAQELIDSLEGEQREQLLQQLASVVSKVRAGADITAESGIETGVQEQAGEGQSRDSGVQFAEPSSSGVEINEQDGDYQEAQLSFDFSDTREGEARSASEERNLAHARSGAASMLRGLNGTVLGNALVKEFKDRSAVSLIGKPIKSTEDLSVLGQIYRNPSFETLRYIFVKDGKVVRTAGVTSRMPGSASIFPDHVGKGASDGVKWLKGMMSESGADSYYMLHNHPSGNPEPSSADLNATKFVASEVPGLVGHVIVNHTTYSTIGPAGGSKANIPLSDEVLADVERQYTSEVRKPHDLLGHKITGPESVMAMADALSNPDNILVVGRGGKGGGVKLITELSPESLKGKSKGYLIAMLKKIMRESGSKDVLIASFPANDQKVRKLVIDGIEKGIILDGLADGKSSLRNSGIGPKTNKTFGGFYRGIEVNEGDGDYVVNEAAQPFTPPPEESWAQTMIRVWQDKFQPLLNLQRAIEKRNGRLPDEQNAYMAEELFHGKVEEDLKAVEKTNVKPLTDYLAENKIDLKELDLYLMAKHASERNAYIASKREDMPDGGSGMTNAEADAILAGFDAEGKTPRLSEAADKVYAITRAQRRVFEVSGLMNPDEVAGWQDQYDFYVPLKGFAEGEKDATTPRRGRGFDIRGKESMKALGRRSMAESPTLHAIQDLTTAVIRYRKNEVGQRLLAMAEANPNQDYWQVFTNENPDMKMAEVDGVIQPVPVRNMGQLKDDYFAVKRDGVEHFIKLKDKRLHNAMQNLGPADLGKFVRYMGAATRYLSMVNTSLNPEFMVSNMARDIQTAVFNVLAEQDVEDGKIRGEALAADMVKGMPSAMKGIMRASFGKPARNDAEREIERYYRDFLADGAKTGYFDSKDIDGLEREVQQLIEISQGTTYGKFLSGKRKITDFVEKTNGAVENAIRLSAYIQARKAGEANPELGMTREQAASLAKNLTVNFNRKGEIGTLMNSLYMFTNASIQGTANFMRAIGTLDDSPLGKTLSNAYTGKKLNRAQKAAGVMMGASFALAALNRAFSEEDDDGVPFFDKVPGYVRERNLVLMKSVLGVGEPGEYWTIPLPYGYNVFYNMGDALESALNSDYQVRRDELLTGLAASFATSFNPIGWHQGGVAPSLAPSLLVPAVELDANTNFFGGPIYKENFAFGPQKADSALSFRSTKEIYKDISEWMNDATGGDTYIEGGIDVSPDTLEHLAEFALGGLYTFATRSYDSVERLLQDRDVPVRNVPFRRKVEGEVTPYADQSEFYDRVERVESLRAQRKELRGRERIEFGKKYGNELRLHESGKAARKQLSRLRRQRDRVESNESLSPKEMDERVERIERRMKRVVDRYNKRYNEAIAGD